MRAVKQIEQETMSQNVGFVPTMKTLRLQGHCSQEEEVIEENLFEDVQEGETDDEVGSE